MFLMYLDLYINVSPPKAVKKKSTWYVSPEPRQSTKTP
jgi:hypothetical protein